MKLGMVRAGRESLIQLSPSLSGACWLGSATRTEQWGVGIPSEAQGPPVLKVQRRAYLKGEML